MLNSTSENPNRVLKVREAASFIASTKSWLDKSRLNGAGPPFVRIGTGVGARVGYRLCDLQNWLATRVRRSTSDTGDAWRSKMRRSSGALKIEHEGEVTS